VITIERPEASTEVMWFGNTCTTSPGLVNKE
jgi:hypothetical protein